jgi:hypothetical protein
MDKITKQDVIDKINEIEHEGQVIEEECEDGWLDIIIKLQDDVICSISWDSYYLDRTVVFSVHRKKDLLVSDCMDIDDFVSCAKNVVKRLKEEDST